LVFDTPYWTDLYDVFSTQTDFRCLETLDIFLSLYFGGKFVLDDSHLRAATLRSLALRFCDVNWNSNFLLHLTHLRLVEIPEKADSEAMILSSFFKKCPL
jgi:hypothetical protein